MVDYKLLLIKYLAIVSEREGSDYLPAEGSCHEGITSVVENSELIKLAKASDQYFNSTGYVFKESSIT